MNAEELRTLQAPFKERYTSHPELAKLTMGASGVLLHDRLTCRVEGQFGPIDAGLHPTAGGDGKDALFHCIQVDKSILYKWEPVHQHENYVDKAKK